MTADTFLIGVLGGRDLAGPLTTHFVDRATVVTLASATDALLLPVKPQMVVIDSAAPDAARILATLRNEPGFADVPIAVAVEQGGIRSPLPLMRMTPAPDWLIRIPITGSWLDDRLTDELGMAPERLAGLLR